MAPQVWFITGCSTGFGREVVKKALAEGDAVIATARNSSKLRFDNTNKNNYIAVDCDVTNEASIENAFAKGLSHFDRIDVVCNNAGYGMTGCFESLTDAQVRHQLEVNFFGLVSVTRKALAIMRDHNKPQGGRILQITSIAGHIGIPMASMYCASKWAVEGFSEALANELNADWNIKLIMIEPGGFRTDWSGRSMVIAEPAHPAYANWPVKEMAESMDGKQIGDPALAAKAFWDIAKMEDPPLRVLLGSDALEFMNQKLQAYGEWAKKWEKFTCSTDGEGWGREWAPPPVRMI